MANRDLVVVGASAGGVDALIRVAAQLPPNFAAAVLVVLHIPPDSPSNLPLILERAGRLPVRHARDGEAIATSTILVAPPDRHLVVHDGHVRLTSGPHENLHRPAVDVLFRSAALHRDGRTVGVILSGALDDGAEGLRVIAASGGLTVVQDPSDAMVPGMPSSALQRVEVDRVLTADEIGSLLPDLIAAPLNGRSLDRDARVAIQEEIAMIDRRPPAGPAETDQPSPFGCPDCGGVLFEADGRGGLRFRCRIGHAYTARALLAAETSGLEEALWAALRALEEQESLTTRLLERRWSSDTGRRRLEARREETRKRAATLREFLTMPLGTEEIDVAGENAAVASEGSTMGTVSRAG